MPKTRITPDALERSYPLLPGEKRPRRSRRRRRGKRTVRTKTRRRDAAAVIHVQEDWDRIAASMVSLLGRPRIPPECKTFKEHYCHENGYGVGGGQGDIRKRRTLEDGQVVEKVRRVKLGTRVRTKQPYNAYLAQRAQPTRGGNADTGSADREKVEQGWRDLELEQANARLRRQPKPRKEQQ